MDDRIIIVNLLAETQRRGQVPSPKYLWDLAQQYKMQFPQVIDAKKQLYRYASTGRIGLPFQVGVDLRTMKIVYAKSGKVTLAFIEQLAKKTLGAKK